MVPKNAPIEEVFSELFYLEEKENVRVFKKLFNAKSGIKLSDITFSEKGRSINEIINMLAKKICEHAEGSESSRNEMLNNSLNILKIKTEEFKDIYFNRVERCKKTLSFMKFSFAELLKAHTRISNLNYQVVS